MESVKPDVLIYPALCMICNFETGRDCIGNARHCCKKATMVVKDIPLCDSHAELAMMQLCGRNVTIQREKNPV